MNSLIEQALSFITTPCLDTREGELDHPYSGADHCRVCKAFHREVEATAQEFIEQEFTEQHQAPPQGWTNRCQCCASEHVVAVFIEVIQWEVARRAKAEEVF